MGKLEVVSLAVAAVLLALTAAIAGLWGGAVFYAALACILLLLATLLRRRYLAMGANSVVLDIGIAFALLALASAFLAVVASVPGWLRLVGVGPAILFAFLSIRFLRLLRVKSGEDADDSATVR